MLMSASYSCCMDDAKKSLQKLVDKRIAERKFDKEDLEDRIKMDDKINEVHRRTATGDQLRRNTFAALDRVTNELKTLNEIQSKL